jgi:hypothetical protein
MFILLDIFVPSYADAVLDEARGQKCVFSHRPKLLYTRSLHVRTRI